MNRRVNRRYQTPLPPDFVHFLVEEQGLSERQKAVVYQFQEVHEDRPEDIYLTKKEFQEWISSIQNRKQNGGNIDESSKK